MGAARSAKVNKYSALTPELKHLGFRKVFVDAIVVGSLGAWDPENARALWALSVTRRYGRLMAYLAVSETIAWSLDKYIHHMTGQQHW